VAARRAAKRKSNFYSHIDVTGFLSVQLALLFLLMVGIAPGHSKWANDLPHAQNAKLQPGALREDAMYVGVQRDGRTYFRQTQIVPDELPSLIRTAMQEGAERKVYLSVDARAVNRDAERVVYQIRLAGITRIAIVTAGNYPR
jgi:biopolymer transport protein ExbD